MAPYKTTPISLDYKITKTVLGFGINGKVVLCTHRKSKENFALKVLPDTPRNRREAELHWDANHTNIVKVVDLYENYSKNNLYIFLVNEMMTGGDLFAKLEKETEFSELEAAHLIGQLAAAVVHLHSLNIAHRDIKPENLLFSDPGTDGVLKLTDFGFAKRTEIGIPKGLRTACFTPYYCAPEILGTDFYDKSCVPYRKMMVKSFQILGTDFYDKSCDCWSIGVVMYILLCGSPPFYSEHSDEMMSPGMKNRIRRAQFEFPDDVAATLSDEAKDLIRNLLKANPAERLTIEEIMHHKWITTNAAKRASSRGKKSVRFHVGDNRRTSNNKQVIQKAAVNKLLEHIRAESGSRIVEIKELDLSESRLFKKRKSSQVGSIFIKLQYRDDVLMTTKSVHPVVQPSISQQKIFSVTPM